METLAVGKKHTPPTQAFTLLPHLYFLAARFPAVSNTVHILPYTQKTPSHGLQNLFYPQNPSCLWM